MDRTDHPLETMESSNGRWVVAPDPRTGLFWRTTPVLATSHIRATLHVYRCADA